MGKIQEILLDHDASDWLKELARQALSRDPVETAREVQILEMALRERAELALGFPRSMASV